MTKIIKINRYINFNVILFILIYFSRSITDAIFVSRGIESNIWINLKYFFVLAAILFSYPKLKRKGIFLKETYSIIFTIFMLLIISIFLQIYRGKIFVATFESCFKLLLPPIYVYCFINTTSFEDIYKCMSVTLIFAFFSYILEIGFANFTVLNFKSINFRASYSPFESHFASGTSIALCVFFSYYRQNKVLSALSFLFVLLTFKRLSVVFAFCVFILPHLCNVNKPISPKKKKYIIVFFISMTLIYYLLLLPQSSILFERLFNMPQREFTMARNTILKNLLNSGYKSSGLGTIIAITHKDLEMDLISILLETTMLGLIIFTLGYWQCAGNNFYTYLYMLFQFTNLLTSHSLSNSFNWILAFICISCISYKKKMEFRHIKRLGLNTIISNKTNRTHFINL